MYEVQFKLIDDEWTPISAPLPSRSVALSIVAERISQTGLNTRYRVQEVCVVGTDTFKPKVIR